MSLKIAVLRDGAEPEDADVVVDARGSPEFYDTVVLGGREMRSIVAIGRVDRGAVIGYGKYTKKPVASILGSKIYIKAIPLSLYIVTGTFQKELEEALAKVMPAEDVIVKKLKELVISERRRLKRSPSLTKLQMYLDGEIKEIPAYISEIIGEKIDRDRLRRIMDTLIQELY